MIIAVDDLVALEETLDVLSTPGALDEIRTAEAEFAAGGGIGADELRGLMEQRAQRQHR